MSAPTPREAQLNAEVESLRTENKLLREKVDLLLRRLDGPSSEQLDPAQLLLMMQGRDAGKADEPVGAEAPWRSTIPSPPPNRARRPRLPDHLPIVEECSCLNRCGPVPRRGG